MREQASSLELAEVGMLLSSGEGQEAGLGQQRVCFYLIGVSF